jgi:peptide/nickel transport system ATP-binding protein
LRSIPPLPGKRDHARESPLPTIAGVPPDLAHVAKGCPFEPRCSERMQVCATREPKEVQMQDGSRVRCFRYGG